jgi:hypothetical protein
MMPEVQDVVESLLSGNLAANRKQNRVVCVLHDLLQHLNK